MKAEKRVDATAMNPATLKTNVEAEAKAVGLDVVITADPVATIVSAPTETSSATGPQMQVFLVMQVLLMGGSFLF